MQIVYMSGDPEKLWKGSETEKGRKPTSGTFSSKLVLWAIGT